MHPVRRTSWTVLGKHRVCNITYLLQLIVCRTLHTCTTNMTYIVISKTLDNITVMVPNEYMLTIGFSKLFMCTSSAYTNFSSASSSIRSWILTWRDSDASLMKALMPYGYPLPCFLVVTVSLPCPPSYSTYYPRAIGVGGLRFHRWRTNTLIQQTCAPTMRNDMFEQSWTNTHCVVAGTFWYCGRV